MRWLAFPAVLAFAVTAISLSACGQARALESFTLEEHDVMVVEAPGCYADCRVSGPRRVCTIREPGCQAVCKTLPECRPGSMSPVKACAVVRARP